jgi:hypothetical protein
MELQGSLRPVLSPENVAKEVIMSKSNPIHVELAYVLVAVVVAVAVRLNLPAYSGSTPELVAVPCDCVGI